MQAQMAALAAYGPRVLALIAFAIYLLAAPGAPIDAAPPTGYPTWDALAGLAAQLPVGHLGFRLHVAAAAAGGLAVLWTARLGIAAGRGDDASTWGALAAAGVLGAGWVFVERALAIGPHAATVAALAGAALLLARVAAGEGAPVGLGLALACGLGGGLDESFLAIVPVAAALLVVRLHRGARFPLAAPAVVACAAAGIYAHALIRGGLGERAPLPASPLDALVDGLGPFGVIAAAAGAIALWRRRRTWWIAAAVTAVAVVEATRARGAPLAWAAAVAAGFGVAALVRTTGRFAPAAGAGIAVIVVLPAAVATATWL